MHKTIITVTTAAFLALGIFAASGKAPAQSRGVLSVLHAGQPVSIKESNGRYELSLFENGPETLGHKVIEVGDDYVVLQDIAGISDTRIPIFSVKGVVTMKVGKQQ